MNWEYPLAPLASIRVFVTLYSDNYDLLGHRKRETNSVKAVLVQSTVVQWVPEVKVSIQMVNRHLMIYR